MRPGKRAIAVFALGFSLAQGALAAGPSCGTTYNSTVPPTVQGTVILQVRITKSGVVCVVNVVDGPPTLEAAAIRAAKQWKYRHYVTRPPRERKTVLVVTLVKGAAPAIEEGMPAGVLGCVIAPKRLRISRTVMENRLLSRVEPVYPPEAQAEHIEGMVVLRINIDKDGKVYTADSVSGPPSLVPASIEAVKQWKYQPYLIGGEPIEVETTVEISFAL
jgi:TonB family protein